MEHTSQSSLDLPSLLTPTQAPGQLAPERILASLEGRTAETEKPSRGASFYRTLLISVLCLSLLVLIVVALRALNQPDHNPTHANTLPQTLPKTPSQDNARPAASPITSTSVPTSAATPATIVDTTPTVTPVASSVATPVTPSSTVPAPKTLAQHTTTRPTSTPTSSTRGDASVPKKNAAATQSPPSVSKSRDEDVDLIAALVAHGAGQPTPLPANPPPNAAGPRAKSAQTLVVRATSGMSTAELVKQCGELGWLEGWLCKRRICSEAWGKDPACPLGGNNQ